MEYYSKHFQLHFVEICNTLYFLPCFCHSVQCQWKRCYCRLSSTVTLDWLVVRNGIGPQHSSWGHVSDDLLFSQCIWVILYLIVLILLSCLVLQLACTMYILICSSLVKSGVMAVRCFLLMGLDSNAETVMILTSVRRVLKPGNITPDILLAE